MKTLATTTQRKRRFLLVLPLLVFPFLTLAFWALGGGQAADTAAVKKPQGLNQQLPGPQLETEKDLTKLRLYQDAGRKATTSGTEGMPALWQRLGFSEKQAAPLLPAGTGSGPGSSLDTQEAKVNERLTQLSQFLDQPRVASATHPRPTPAARPRRQEAAPERISQDVARLETLLHTLGNRPAGQAADPQLQQLEGMLERILDIQHPERVKSRLQRQASYQQQPAFPLTGRPAQPILTQLEADNSPREASIQAPQDATLSPLPGFFDVHSPPVAQASGNTLAVAIHETQTVVSGGVIRLRLLEEATLAAHTLPKGSLLYGTCQVAGERLTIEVSTVPAGQSILPVSLSAYDLDGLEGLYIPGSATREAARQGSNRLFGQTLPPLSPSLGAQAAGVGLVAAQDLLRRKARQVKITLKAGHQLLLREAHLRANSE